MYRSLTVMLACLLCANAGVPAPAYDVVLRGGTIVDGTGRPRYRADVAVRGGMVVAISPELDARGARQTIDASGLIVAPGFIDPHAHITGIDASPMPENFLRQGVTTIVNSLHSLDQPYPLGPYLAGLHVAPNTVWTAGHSWERKRVIGLADRAPTAVELLQMKHLVSEAMDDGAVGLATGLEYIPANYALTDEIVALARASRRPHAVYLTHLRDEGSAVLAAIDEALTVGRAAGLPVHIDHLKVTGARNWGASAAILSRFDAFQRRGGHIGFDVYPYTAYSTVSTVLFPSWVLAGGTQAYRDRIADPAVRKRLKAEMLTIYTAQTGGTLRSIQFRSIVGVDGFAGKTLEDYLASKGLAHTLDAGIDAVIDLQASGGFEAIFEAMDERDMIAFLRDPRSSISTDGDLVTIGKGYPHPRSYGSFPRVLARYVRERPVLTLESAVHKMTGQVADELDLVGRGHLAVGTHADIVVFDPATIADRATYADPHHYAVGIVQLLVNGTPVILDGQLTGARPGVPIRRAGWRRGLSN